MGRLRDEMAQCRRHEKSEGHARCVQGARMKFNCEQKDSANQQSKRKRHKKPDVKPPAFWRTEI